MSDFAIGPRGLLWSLVAAALALSGACGDATGSDRPAQVTEGGASAEAGVAGAREPAGGVAAGEGGADGRSEGGADGRSEGGASAEPSGGASAEAGSGGERGVPEPHPFVEEEILEFRIRLSEEAIAALSAAPLTYQAGSLEFRGEIFEDVGVRLKGRASAQGFDGKPAFKIKVNEFVSGQRLNGLKRLTLNNMVQDPTMMRERLGFAYLRSLGLPAPRCNHARVFVNDEYYGLYLNLETLDEIFVRRTFPGAPLGNLFDISNDTRFIDFDRSSEPPLQESQFVLETNEEAADVSDLTALIDAVYGSPIEDFMESVEAVLDLDQVLLLGAAQALLADWDGYFGARNNYKAYHELERDRFVIFPWGIDQTFGPERLDYAIDHSQSQRPRSIVYNRCAELPQCVTRYRSHVQDALDAFVDLPLARMLETWLAQAQPDIDADMRQPHSAEKRAVALDGLRTFLTERPTRVSAQLEP
jgi:CotH kinase protein